MSVSSSSRTRSPSAGSSRGPISPFAPPRRPLRRSRLHIKEQVAFRNLPVRARAGRFGQTRREGQYNALPTFAHGGDAFVPGRDDTALADHNLSDPLPFVESKTRPDSTNLPSYCTTATLPLDAVAPSPRRGPGYLSRRRDGPAVVVRRLQRRCPAEDLVTWVVGVINADAVAPRGEAAHRDQRLLSERLCDCQDEV